MTGFVFHSYIKTYICFDKALYIDFSTYNAYLVFYYHQQSLIKTVKKKKTQSGYLPSQVTETPPLSSACAEERDVTPYANDE